MFYQKLKKESRQNAEALQVSQKQVSNLIEKNKSLVAENQKQASFIIDRDKTIYFLENKVKLLERQNELQAESIKDKGVIIESLNKQLIVEKLPPTILDPINRAEPVGREYIGIGKSFKTVKKAKVVTKSKPKTKKKNEIQNKKK